MKRRLLNTLCLLIVGSFASLGVRADASFLRYAPLLGVTSSPEPKAVLEDGGKTLRLVYDSKIYGDEDADWFPIREGSLDVGAGSQTGILYGHMRELDAYLYAYSIQKIVVDSSFAAYRPTRAYGWFVGFPSLTSIEGLSYFNTSQITDMSYMFYNCSALTLLDVSGFDTSNARTMSYMFYGCRSVSSLDVSGFDLTATTSLDYMFANCCSLEELDLSSLSFTGVGNANDLFYNCSSLVTVFVAPDMGRLANASSAFYGCTSIVGGAGTRYNSLQTGTAYAHIDEPDDPGYLTVKPGAGPYWALFVDDKTGDDAFDGSSISCPKKTINAAVNGVRVGGRVYVSTGVYGSISTGNKNVSIRAWNRTGEVVIDGGKSQRCATLGNSTNDCATVLRGFVLRNGSTGENPGGAGVCGGTVENCVISNCTANCNGGGAALSRLSNCQISGCTARSAVRAAGGGIAYSTATHCRIVGCAAGQGGAAVGSTLDNCLVLSNKGNEFAALYNCSACNCTLAANYDPEEKLIGDSTLANCIVHPKRNLLEAGGNVLHNCYTADPSFRDAANGDYRLAYGSPCVNAGDNAYVTCSTDLAGRQRIDDLVVDIGCYELRDYLKALDYAGEPGSVVFNDNKDSDWLIDTSVWSYGGSSIQTAPIGANGSTGVTLMLSGEGLLTYEWKVESERNYDCLWCYVDNVPRKLITGTEGWNTVELYLEGDCVHVVEWRYTKDGSVDTGRDCGWIDHVVWNRDSENPRPGIYSEIVNKVEWVYRIVDGQAVLGGGTPDLGAVAYSANGSVTTPSSLGGHTVREIGDYAFYCRTDISSFTVANQIVRIGNSAFEGCSNLNELRIPAAVVSVGSNAFYGCSSILSMTIPATLKECGDNVLTGCSRLQDLVVYAPLANLLRCSSCPELESIWYCGAGSMPPGSYDGLAGATLYVWRDSTGWGVPIPGTWCGINIDYIENVSTRQLAALDFDGTGVLTDENIPRWSIDSSVSMSGGSSLRTGRIPHSGSTFVTLLVEGKGNLSFYWKASSESNCDNLRCFVDGVEYERISGETGWQEVSFDIASDGPHEIKWQYSKDGSAVRGDDCGWIDRLVWTSGVGTIGKDVLLWAPSVRSDAQVGALVPKLMSALENAYGNRIPADSRFAANYPDGIVVRRTGGSTGGTVALPGNLQKYALVFVILPCYEIPDADVARLKTVVDRGGRVVLQAEHALFSATENAQLTKLAADMGADFSILTGQKAGADTYNMSCNILSKPTLLTQLPESKSVAPISYSGVAQEVARLSDDSFFVWAVDEVSGNGRITVFSDNNWYCDSGTSSGTLYEDAIPLLERLLSNAIENEQKVLDEEDPNADIEENVPDWAVAAVRDDNNLLTYYSNVVSACSAASSGRAVTNRLTVVLKKDVAEDFQLPEGVTFETTGITTNYAGEISVPSGCELVVNATHDVYKSVSVHPPAVPRSVTASDGAYTNKVEISWIAPDSEKPITAYEVKRVKVGSTLETVLSSTITGTSYSDTSARSGIHYIYYVRAQSSAGWGFAGSDEGWRSANGQVPDPVLEVTATAGTETNGVVVTWQPDTNSAISVTHYEVSRAPKGTDDWTTLTSTVDPSETSFTDTGATPGVEYDYEVRAGNGSGWSEGVRSDGPGWRMPSLSVSPTLVELGPGPDDADIAVSANGMWSYLPDDEWLSGERISGGLRISARENPEFAMRTGMVYVIVGSAGHAVSNAVLVIQAARPRRPMTLTVDGPDTLVVGTTNAYVATVTYNDGSTVNKSIEAIWSAAPDGFAASVVKGDTNVTLKVGAAVSGSLTLRAEYSETCAAAGGLVAWYRLDGNGKDSSVYGNHAVEHGVVPTTDHNGKANGAYYFNGSTYLEAPDHYALYSVSNVISVCAWMKPSSMSGWQYALCKSTVHEIRQYGLGVNGNRFYINDGEAAVYRPYGDLGPLWTDVSKTLVVGEWHHVMVTYDGNVVKAYLDAELVGSKTVTGYFHDAPGGLLLGYDPPGEIEYYTGALDDVRIYNRALSADQVAVVCAGGAVADSGTETVTVAGTKTITVALPPVPGTPVVSATDGSQTNQVSVSWTVPSSTCPITAYEVSRQQKGTSGWTVLTNELTSTNYVDTAAAPGEDYIYRVRAQNIGGWGGYGSDTGWQAIALSLDPTTWSPSYGATNLAVSVTSNTGWAVADSEGAATVTTTAGGLNVALPANTTLSDRSGSVTVTAGGSTDHPVSKTFTYTQSKRPPKLTGLEIIGGSSSVEGGASTNFQVIAIFDDGTTNDVTSVATWSIDHPEYGGISAGRLTTHETTDTNRSVRVSATYEYTTYEPTTLTATEDVDISFTMRLKRPVFITISGPETVRIAESGSYSATVRYNNGDEADVTLSADAVWSTDPARPVADLKKGKADWQLTPYAGGTNVVLTVVYTETCGKSPSGDEPVSVTNSLTVTVPATIPLPIAVDAESMVFATDASPSGTVWYGQAKVSHDGIDAAQSGKIFGAGESWMSTTVTNAGDVSFWWKTSCEPTYDNLTFAVDGVVKARTSGTTNDWRQLKFEIPGGTHTLRWTYAKDGKNDVGQDCGWVDQLVWDPLPAPSPTTNGVAGAAIAASDGTSADYVEVEWSPFDSRWPISKYELSRAVKGSADWEVLLSDKALRFVDTSALPGVDYTYRVRAYNAAGWGDYILDDGWRACVISVEPDEVLAGQLGEDVDLQVRANAAWEISVEDDTWLKADRSSETNATLVVSDNASLVVRTNGVTVTVRGASGHPISVVVPVVQVGRPPVYDVGFIKPYEDWRTRLQITTNSTDDAYAPVSVFTIADALNIGFGWTNRSEVAVAMPSVRFRLYVPDADSPVAEWIVEGRAEETLNPNQGGWSGGWPFETLKVLKPGDYRLEAELGPELNDVNREGDLDSDKSDNTAIFRFAVKNPALDVSADIFTGDRWFNLVQRWGNDFAQPPHVAVRTVMTNETDEVVLPSVQFGPYVPMDGVNGRRTAVKKPLDVVFLIDYTGSMGNCIAGLVNNIGTFIDKLFTGDPENGVAPIEDLRVKIVGYSDCKTDTGFMNWFAEGEFTTDRTVLKTDLDNLRRNCNGGGANGGESAYEALYYICKGWSPNAVRNPTGHVATGSPFRPADEATRVVILFTDEPPHVPLASASGCSGLGYSDVDAALREANVNLTVIGDGHYRYDERSWDDGWAHGHERFQTLVSMDEDTRELIETGGYGTLPKFTQDATKIGELASLVSSKVPEEVTVVEPVLSVMTRGAGTLTFSWKNDSTAEKGNEFFFECEGVTNMTAEIGEVWRHETVELASEGVHVFRWTYGKLGYDGGVTDCGVLANVVWSPYRTELELNPNSFECDHSGSFEESDEGSKLTVGEGNLRVGVTCNTDWKVVTNDVPDWIVLLSSQGSGDGDISFQVASNATYEAREATITVRAGEYGRDDDDIVERTFHVWQKEAPFVPDDQVHILKVEVKPRWPWNQKVDVDFRIVLPRDGTSAKITMTGLNGEGGDMVDDFPVLKQLKECPAKNNVYHGFGKKQPDAPTDGNSKLKYIECVTSGLYRITWDMGTDWYKASDAARKLKDLGLGPANIDSTRVPWVEDKFHTPAFSVRLKAVCGDGETIKAEEPSNVVRVDMRILDMTDQPKDPYATTMPAGGKILTGMELIGHPDGAVDPVKYDTRDAKLFPSNGWNSLNFVAALDGTWSNRCEAACVINDRRVAIEGGMITSNTIWGADRVHVVRDNVFVPADFTLTIEENAVVKFCDCTHLYVYEDKTAALKTVARHNIIVKGAYLTYGYDDTYDGDTLYHKNEATWWNFGKNVIYSQGSPEYDQTEGTDEIAWYTTWREERAITRVQLKVTTASAGGTPTDFKDRYYSYEQPWGTLPRPSIDGCAFYGWYSSDPSSISSKESYKASTGTMLNTDQYPYAKPRYNTIFALMRPSGWATSAWERIDASRGHVALNAESVVYDGNSHQPDVVSLRVNDAEVVADKFNVDYGSGDYTGAGEYSVGVTFVAPSDYTGSPTATFTIEPRPIEGGEILFSDPTNGVMYLPGRTKKPTVTVHLPAYKGSAIDDEIATRDAVITDLESTDSDTHVWPEVGEYRVVASYEGNANYTGGALTNFFRISVNPDYVFKEYGTLEEAESHANDKIFTDHGVTPRILRFSGRPGDILLEYWKDQIRGNTRLNDYICEHFVCWAEETDGAPSIGIRDLDDDLRDIVTMDGVDIVTKDGALSVTELLELFDEAFEADELPVDASSATLALSSSSFTYNGAEHYPSVTVTFAGETIKPENYTLDYSGDGINVGDYSVRAVFFGKEYMGETAAIAYTVVPKALTASDVSIDPESAVYDGRMHKPTVSTGIVTCLPPDYGTGDFAAIGTYPITVTASGNYTGSVTTNFTIVAREVVNAVIELDDYSAEVKKDGVSVDVRPHVLSVYDAERTYEKDVDYTVDYGERDYTSVGTYTITANFRGCYSGSTSVEFVVTEAPETVVETVSIEGDPGAVLEPTAEGITVRPSEGVKSVVVVIPTSVDKTKVTVEVSSAVESVTPNGATIKVVNGGYDITGLIVIPAADADGVVDLTKATVIDEVLSEVLNPDVDGTIIDLKDTDNPVLRTVTRKGLFYLLYEGRGLDTMTGGDSTIGNGELWTPEISVKGGNSAFYRIGVAPHEE